MAEEYSIVCVYHIFFNHSSTDGHFVHYVRGNLLVFTIDYDVSYGIFICDLYHVEVISFY